MTSSFNDAVENVDVLFLSTKKARKLPLLRWQIYAAISYWRLIHLPL